MASKRAVCCEQKIAVVLRSRAEPRASVVLLVLGLSWVLLCPASTTNSHLAAARRSRTSTARHRCQRPLRPRLRRISSVPWPSLHDQPERGLRIHRVRTTNPGPHTRIAGAVSASGYAPLPWLALSLRLDGRRDTHPPDEDGPDSTMVGDPAYRSGSGVLSAHSRRRPERWASGSREPARLPSSRRRPALDLKLLASHRSRQRNLVRARHVGLSPGPQRQERTGRQEQDPAGRSTVAQSQRLQRVLLGVLGVNRASATRGEAFLELSADLLVGKRAPRTLRQSPLRVSVGGRYFFSNALQLEAALSVSLSQRPSLAGTPRGSRASLGSMPAPVCVLACPRPSPSPLRGPTSARSRRHGPDPQGPYERPEPASDGLCRDRRSWRTSCSIQPGSRSRKPRSSCSWKARHGRPSAMPSADTLSRRCRRASPSSQLSATGFLGQSLKISVMAGMAPLAEQQLEPAEETGVLRCVTRTFASEPLGGEHRGARRPTASRSPKVSPTSRVSSRSSSHLGRYQVIITALAIAHTVVT